jgi:heme-degrading monooxygenase HmoA
MIARIWRGVTKESEKDKYFAYLQETGLKEYAAIPGNRGVWTLRRVADGRCEFTLISLWDSMEAIKAFAGPDPEKAVFYPEDNKFLVERGPRVQHYEVLSTPDRTVEAAPEI